MKIEELIEELDYVPRFIVDRLSKLFCLSNADLVIGRLYSDDILNEDLSEMDELTTILKFIMVDEDLVMVPFSEVTVNFDAKYKKRMVFRVDKRIYEILTEDCYNKVHAIVDVIIRQFEVKKVIIHHIVEV